MTKIALLLTLLVTALVCLLSAAPAQAQAARTFVSAAGSDSNSCINVATPCRHLAAAYAATAPNGEIYVLDPANYGSLTITGPVSIEGHGWASIAPIAGQAAITINALGATDKINIVGVVLDGTALTSTNGIVFNSGGTLTVRDSVIRNFGNNGVKFVPNSSTPSHLLVSNTVVSDNGADGIHIFPLGSGTTIGVLNRVEMENNGGSGLTAITNSQVINVTVNDSVSATNSLSGILAQTIIGATTLNILVRSSIIANNGVDGLEANGGGSNAIVLVTRSTIMGNAIGWQDFGVGTVVSYGDNNIDFNTGGNSEPALVLPYK
jgi:hypothetical protein